MLKTFSFQMHYSQFKGYKKAAIGAYGGAKSCLHFCQVDPLALAPAPACPNTFNAMPSLQFGAPRHLGHVNESSASYLPDQSVPVKTTLYIWQDFCCHHNIEMDSVPTLYCRTENKIVLTYLCHHTPLTSHPCPHSPTLPLLPSYHPTPLPSLFFISSSFSFVFHPLIH